ncbi:twin-arginine translocase subunit TatC [Sulfoacidibacillus thermotolerans]|uniref:Sec-independent protein translocase protein TatC n=1 Tax=Sulfoacidibacillus thermotolerans TaxID=1765684 RepID=A0A2U3D5V5_SULT2|nr:twin-arginine translocase subunit TatC [Sulfoacidibacillus thermotolerans]PWI56663.1 twin arginine-targeting protein translocase TatC [Sulfoacidibacillus thermotolerans]
MQKISLVKHLDELRKRLLFVLVFFLFALIVALIFVGNVYSYLVIPARGLKLVVLGPGDVVQIYLTIAGVAAFAITTPFLLWQLWRFVGPGLLPKERKYAGKLIGPASAMFLLGVAFGYYVIFPEIFRFLRQLAQMHFDVMFTATEYFSFMFNIVIPFGILFELPVVVMFLTRIGVITPFWLRKVRRFAYFAFVILGVFISPPELVSHLSVVIPMILIYELSIGISAIAYRKKLAAEAWWRADQQKEVGIVTTTAPLVDAVEDKETETIEPSAEILEMEQEKPSSADQQQNVEARSQVAVVSPRPGLDIEERE